MRYGSPRQALVMTLCIRPCTASGYSHENALSMRTGLPSSSTNRSSGDAGQPSASAGERRVRLAPRPGCSAASRSAGSRAGTAPCGESRRAGRSCRAATSGSRARGSSGSRSNAPRARASRGTRPDCRSRSRARRPSESVQGIGSSIFWSRAVTPISCARRRIVAAGMPVMLRRPFGRVLAHALRRAAGTRASPACRRAA